MKAAKENCYYNRVNFDTFYILWALRSHSNENRTPLKSADEDSV